ncbi:MAG: HupE/UreJ family protein [Gammaproteobacteria bacterium]|nr:HupE/UreJ family protein [Gammaproteobacteria bacterium]
MMPRTKLVGSERSMFFVTCTICLLHGLGFSFVLHKILQITSPDIWQSLLAFNVGVEIGQLTIILAAWPMFRLIQRSSDFAWRIDRNGIAIPWWSFGCPWGSPGGGHGDREHYLCRLG